LRLGTKLRKWMRCVIFFVPAIANAFALRY
jgi:hypothetical protein